MCTAIEHGGTGPGRPCSTNRAPPMQDMRGPRVGVPIRCRQAGRQSRPMPSRDLCDDITTSDRVCRASPHSSVTLTELARVS